MAWNNHHVIAAVWMLWAKKLEKADQMNWIKPQPRLLFLQVKKNRKFFVSINFICIFMELWFILCFVWRLFYFVFLDYSPLFYVSLFKGVPLDFGFIPFGFCIFKLIFMNYSGFRNAILFMKILLFLSTFNFTMQHFFSKI